MKVAWSFTLLALAYTVAITILSGVFLSISNLHHGRKIAEPDSFSQLLIWLHQNGGQAVSRIGYTSQGLRGLFAPTTIPRGGMIIYVPEEALISMTTSLHFKLEVLAVVNELRDASSYFRQYTSTFPPPSEALSLYNFPREYIHMLESNMLESWVHDCQEAMRSLYALGQQQGSDRHKLVRVLRDSSLEELKYVATLVLSRHFGRGGPHAVTALVPVLDMVNHKRGCKNTVNITRDPPGVQLVAGEDIPEGDEICLDYGPLRDDQTLLKYGFLDQPQEPPLLCAVDHPDVDPQDLYNELPVVPFDGELEGLSAALRIWKFGGNIN